MPILELHGIHKSYGPARALAGAALALRSGEVHALMGENGAGKSTLIRIIAGIERADAGTVTLDGAALALGSPAAARDAGFRVLHQEMQIVPGLCVAENMHLAHRYPSRGGFVRWSALRAAAAAALARLGAAHIAPGGPMARLGPGDRMLVRIAATLIGAQDGAPWLYVFDEPTAALTGAEAEQLFAAIGGLRRAGCAILYVSHRMDEVMALCQRITVLRDGAHVASFARADADQAAVIAAMTGREIGTLFPPRTAGRHEGKGLVMTGLSAGQLHSLTLSVGPGEVVGLAGLSGSGRNAALKAVIGGIPRRAGQVTLAGVPVRMHPAGAWRQGIAYVPRERRAEGVMLDRALSETVTLPHLAVFARLRAFVSRHRERAAVGRLVAEVRLKARGPRQAVGQLSGGNQQKVLFARAIAARPRALLLDEPTRGVDVGAKADIYATIRALSAQGIAVLVASSDLPELIGLCDRIAVLHRGRLSRVVAAAGLTEAALLSHCYAAAEGADGAAS